MHSAEDRKRWPYAEGHAALRSNPVDISDEATVAFWRAHFADDKTPHVHLVKSQSCDVNSLLAVFATGVSKIHRATLRRRRRPLNAKGTKLTLVAFVLEASSSCSVTATSDEVR